MDDCFASPSTSKSSINPGFNSPAPSDILKGVVAYVEVRTANDNRSAAVKWVLERMGAKVEEKFTEDVTHVIFKEGKKRTRDKAQKLGIHLVSILWVDSCKEKQERVPEHEFSANTERCGTPPPGIRWKKYKSMQPRDFEDEMARSAERCQKRQRRKDNYKQLLQGGESATPFHAPAHVLVVDTQPPCTPVFSLDIQTPVIIPNTPPSMQARLTQLIREKEARRLGGAVESPLSTSVSLDVQPLQRALFRDKNPSQEENLEKLPVSRRKSSRLSGCTSRDEASQNPAETQKSSDHIKPQTSSQPNHGTKKTVVSETEYQNSAARESESEGSESGKEQRHRSESNPETTLPPLGLIQRPVRQKRRVTQQSLPSMLPQTVQNSSQVGELLSRNVEQNDDQIEDSTVVGAHSSINEKILSQETKKRKRDSNISTIENKKRTRHSGRQKTGSDAHDNRHSSKKGKHDNGNGTEKLVSQKNSESTSSYISNSKPVTKRRKLLNPSQELQILSPSPTENPNSPSSAAEDTMQQKRGTKRKSCDVDAVFPSSLPASKRGRGSAHMKENRGKKASSTRSDISSNKQSSPESSVKGRKKTVAKKRSAVQKNKGDESVSSLSSISHSSSILGASMSMVFNNSSRTSQSRFAPPRNSLAEFKVAKPKGQGKRGPCSKDGSSQEVSRDPKRMSLHKFRLSCMPSLVMTSLHRDEQDFVIHAVKRLGVFRMEDKVSKHTTHVVCGEPRRTLNILNGLARGCWLVSKQWVERSMEDGHWINEEDYEMAEEIPVCKEARLAREAEEPGSYQCRIFESVGSIFVSNECTPPRAQLVKLLQLCGAKVTDSIQRADFYIGDSAHDEKNCIKPVWVLDSISQQELLPMDDYILAINHKPKSCGSPEY